MDGFMKDAQVALAGCRDCGKVQERNMFTGKISKGKRIKNKYLRKPYVVNMPTGQCAQCVAVYRKRKRREKPTENMTNSQLARLGFSYTKYRSTYWQNVKAERDARVACAKWIKELAPDEWVSMYFEINNKPWANPRLSDAEQYAIRYRKDAEFRCAELVRARVNKKRRREDVTAVIRSAALGKSTKTTLLNSLGYNKTELRKHIERQFTKRMTWKAFANGKIHIDHIRPLSAFDLSDEQQFRDAFSLHNMRPMWARDNLAKGRRVEHLL